MLKQYMSLRAFKQKLEKIKNNLGYAPIYSISELSQVQKWQNNGLNIVCLFQPEDIKECGETIEYL